VLTRVLVMLIFLTPAENYANGDVFYYWRKLQALSTSGLSAVMPEYPVPAVWVLQLPLLLGGGDRLGYAVVFIGGLLLLDAVFTAGTWWLGRPRPDDAEATAERSGQTLGRQQAVIWWILFLVAVGPLAYLRFDLIPAVLVGGALLLSVRHPAVAGVLAAAGAGVKLWPALVWPALATRREGRWRTTVTFLVTGVVLAGTSLLAGGWARLVSPLTWQSDRGLQIESIAATPLMLARALDPSGWRVKLSKYNAYEIITGPGIDALLSFSTIATAVGLLLVLGLVVLAGVQRTTDPWRVGLLVLAVVLVMIVTNKTFSPQYVIWLGGPVVHLLLHAGTAAPRRRTSARIAVAVLAVAVLTHVVYPLWYSPLIRGGPELAGATTVLVMRNLLLVALTGWIIVRAIRPPAAVAVQDDEKPGPGGEPPGPGH